MEEESMDHEPEAGSGNSPPGQEAQPATDREKAETADHSGAKEVPLGKPVDEGTFEELKRRATAVEPEEEPPPQHDD